MLDHMIAAGFIKPAHRELFLVENEPAQLLDRLAHHVMPELPSKLSAEET
jgi:predicted Rossmann-fold nucleotide-binding protein